MEGLEPRTPSKRKHGAKERHGTDGVQNYNPQLALTASQVLVENSTGTPDSNGRNLVRHFHSSKFSPGRNGSLPENSAEGISMAIAKAAEAGGGNVSDSNGKVKRRLIIWSHNKPPFGFSPAFSETTKEIIDKLKTLQWKPNVYFLREECHLSTETVKLLKGLSTDTTNQDLPHEHDDLHLSELEATFKTLGTLKLKMETIVVILTKSKTKKFRNVVKRLTQKTVAFDKGPPFVALLEKKELSSSWRKDHSLEPNEWNLVYPELGRDSTGGEAHLRESAQAPHTPAKRAKNK